MLQDSQAWKESIESIKQSHGGLDAWSARELAPLLGYGKNWRGFLDVIKKAKISCKNIGINPEDEFIPYKMDVMSGYYNSRKINDFILSRYACYMVAMNGNPVIEQVSWAQTYFVVETRKSEIIKDRIKEISQSDAERVRARRKLKETERKFTETLLGHAVTPEGVGRVRSHGDQVLFGGKTTDDMKQKYGLNKKKSLADVLPTVAIKAKDLAAEMTTVNVKHAQLQGEIDITIEHRSNNESVRNALKERGIIPENLPPEEDTAILERRIVTTEKLLTMGTPLPFIAEEAYPDIVKSTDEE